MSKNPQTTPPTNLEKGKRYPKIACPKCGRDVVLNNGIIRTHCLSKNMREHCDASRTYLNNWSTSHEVR